MHPHEKLKQPSNRTSGLNISSCTIEDRKSIASQEENNAVKIMSQYYRVSVNLLHHTKDPMECAQI